MDQKEIEANIMRIGANVVAINAQVNAWGTFILARYRAEAGSDAADQLQKELENQVYDHIQAAIDSETPQSAPRLALESLLLEIAPLYVAQREGNRMLADLHEAAKK